MANISSESRADFQDKARPIKEKIEASLKKEKELLLLMKKDSKLATFVTKCQMILLEK